MIDKKFWEDKFKILDKTELQEVQKILTQCLIEVDAKEDFIDVLKRFAAKYPQCKYFITGSAWKGAYECEGEWGTSDWDHSCIYGDDIDDIWNNLIDYAEEKNIDHGDIEILLQFESLIEFKKSILNYYLEYNSDEYKDFRNALSKCTHAPVWELDDAEGLNNGDTLYELVDLNTFEKKYLCTNAY